MRSLRKLRLRRLGMRWCALLAAASVIGSPAAADVGYVAYGDSITRGNDCYYPAKASTPDDIFDGDGPSCSPNKKCSDQTQADADGCGYSWRLEDSLRAAGIDASVLNAGSAGERTPDGLTRIDDWMVASDDVLLLMEGTNDVSLLMRDASDAILPAVIKANLAAMIDKATAKGIVAAVATVIERVCPTGFPSNCEGPDPQANPNEKWTNDLNDKIRDLAEEAERGLVAPDNSLCKTQSCVNKNYYGPDFKFGHLDADGYDVMAPLFEEVILDDVALAAPVALAPLEGSLDDATLVWEEADGATLYQVQLDDAGGGSLYDEWHDGTDICGGGECSVALPFSLARADHSWRVRANNLRGRSPWSPWIDFTVYDVPAQPVLISPPPDVFDDTPPLQPTYTWHETEDAVSYRLVVDGVDGTVHDEVLDASTTCSGGICSDKPPGLAEGGAFSWKVQASNPAASGAFSPSNSFVAIDSTPSSPTPLAPFIDTFSRDPEFEWSHVVGATGYDLQIDGVVTALSAGDVCTESSCSIRLGSELAIGDHLWRIRGTNPLGNGSWSSILSFEVLACSPENLTLGPADVGTGSEFSACIALTAGSGFVVRGGENVTLHAGERVILESGFSVEGALTVRVD